jgi:LacI family transcriptional regulator
MKITIKDVAREAGVSDTTVSLVFSGHSRITAETRQRVLRVAERLCYIPHLPARHLRLGGAKILGFLVNDISNPFYVGMIRAAKEVARKSGYQMVIADSQWDPVQEREHLQTMFSSGIRGLLAIMTEQSSENIELIASSTAPVMLLDTSPEKYRGAFFGNDLESAGAIAARHLMEVGCRRLVWVGGPLQWSEHSSFVKLKNGFEGEISKKGKKDLIYRMVDGGVTLAEGEDSFRRLHDFFPEVDGVFCANDLCAIGFIDEADRAGRRVGKDLRVMGVDDLDVSRLGRISLTSIRQPYEKIAQEGMKALIESVEQQKGLKKRKVFQPELIVRGSTGFVDEFFE